MAAIFHVDAVFRIEGRGTVLQGTVVSGEINAGMCVRIPTAPSPRRIVAVEGIHGPRIQPGSIGLVLDDGGPNDVRDLIDSVEERTVDIN